MRHQHGSACSRRQTKTNLSAYKQFFLTMSLGDRHFSRIVNDPDHPLLIILIFYTGRIPLSSRDNAIFRLAVCRSEPNLFSSIHVPCQQEMFFSNHTIFLHFYEHLGIDIECNNINHQNTKKVEKCRLLTLIFSSSFKIICGKGSNLYICL